MHYGTGMGWLMLPWLALVAYCNLAAVGNAIANLILKWHEKFNGS